ncbi:MAG: ATP-binding protein, partial [Myxococcota bacterium]
TSPVRQPKSARTLEQFILSRHTHATVVVSDALEIQSFFGPTGDYLTQPTGDARLDLLAWVKPGLYPRLRHATEHAVLTGERVVVDDISIERGQQTVRVNCTVEPLRPAPGEPRVLLISFRDVGAAPARDTPAATDIDLPLLHQLETELKVTREELRGTIEQLDVANEDYRASNEELLSLNEELQSNNEELETSREELQSVNDEMAAINQQLEERNLELRQAYADLSNLLESTNIPIVFLDRQLNIRRFTPAARNLLPLRIADIGRPLEELREHFSDADFVPIALSVLETQTAVATEVRARDGRWFNQTVSPYRTEEGHIDGVSVAFHDVTETKAAARIAEEERAFADAIVHTIPSPLLVLKRSLQIVSGNRSFYERFGLTSLETVGRDFFEIGDHAWDLPRMRTLLSRILPEDEEVRDYEVELMSSTVGRRLLHINARMMRREGEGDLILLLIDDVTALRNAELFTARRADDLAKEARRKDDFLAMLGHELRNPLSALVHGLDLWQALGAEPERLENVRLMMSRQAQRMRAMLDQLLEVSRLKAGRLQFTFAPVDVAAAIEAAIETAAPVVARREHRLTRDVYSFGEVYVSADEHRLVQAIENVLTNAARFTPPGGNIHVTLRASPSKVRISIRDDGIGIEPDLLPHLFELFTQGPRDLDRAEGGLGLGLPLVKSIVELHGGTVEIVSEGRGSGSEVIIALTRHLMSVEQAPGEARAEVAMSVASRRILIVDDEADCGETLAEILALRGYQTLSVRDGAAALTTTAT